MITDVQLSGLLLLCFAVFGFHFRRRGHVRVADPAFLLFAMFGAGTAVKLVYFVFFRAKNYPESLNVRHDPVMMGKSETFLVVGMIFITLSVAAYCLGLWHRRAVSLRHADLRLDEKPLRALSILACAATLAGLTIFLHRTDAFATGELFAKRFNDIPGGAVGRFFVADYWIFKAISSIKYFFYTLLIYWLWNGERASKAIYILLGATLVLSLLAPSVVGSRAHSFVILLDLIVLAALLPSRRRIALLSGLIAIAIAFTGATAVARYTRPSDPERRHANNQRAIEEQTAAAAVAEERGGYRTLDADRVERSRWFTRLIGIDAAKKIDVQLRGRYFLDLYKTAHIVDEVPEQVPFLHGQSFYGWPFVLVPPSAWPDKPTFAGMAPMLAEEIFLEPSNNIPPGLVGEAWLNFGWFGLLAVAVVGALMGLAYNSFLDAREDATVQVIYAMLLTRVSFIMFNTSFGDAVLKFAIDSLPVLLLLLIMHCYTIRRATGSEQQ